MKTTYFITTFTRLEQNDYAYYDLGGLRTVGFYSDLEEARHIVKNNVCDLCETIYEYIIIEGIESDVLYPETVLQELYQVRNITQIIDDKEYYNLNLTYEQIDLPVDFQQSSLIIG